jgi:sarcosine oxidase
MNYQFDYIVIGVGSMGSSTCYHLAKSGARVLGIEQFELAHEKGAHSGQSRIVRKAYFEHPDYIPLLERAYQNWTEIEQTSGSKLYHQTGLFYTGPQGHPIIENIRAAAKTYKIPLLDSTQQDEISILPLFTIPDDYEWIYEPEAGFVETEKTILTYVEQAKKLGAVIHQQEKVIDWQMKDDGVEVRTDKGHYTCRKIIVTAGPWSAKLMPEIKDQLKITRQTLIWLQPEEPTLFQSSNFPCWFVVDRDKPGAYYGFPIANLDDQKNPNGFKFAYHHPGEETDPDEVNRIISQEDTGPLLEFIDTYIPKAKGQVLGVKTCLYSNSQDEHFVIDSLRDSDGKVCFARGFSGHGFKFVSVVGEIMADLALKGTTSLPIGFLRADRFEND